MWMGGGRFGVGWLARRRCIARFGWVNQEDRAADAELDGILAAYIVEGCRVVKLGGLKTQRGSRKLEANWRVWEMKMEVRTYI